MSAATPKKTGLPEALISPFELACACYLYESITRYARALETFRADSGGAPDLSQQSHRAALLKFLNDWGCRNLAKAWHGQASNELKNWYGSGRAALRVLDVPLAALDQAHLRDAARVFKDLCERTAARPIRYGKKVDVSFGPTATSKTLFALRPGLFPAWDAPMRKAFGYDGRGKSYARFAKEIHSKIEETAQDFQSLGLSLDDLPAKLGRPSVTTAVQLMVEYYWITTTRGVSLPSKDATEWLSWCDRA